MDQPQSDTGSSLSCFASTSVLEISSRARVLLSVISRASFSIKLAGFSQAWAFGCGSNKPSASRCLAASRTSPVSASSGSRYLTALVITGVIPIVLASWSILLACMVE